MGFVGWFFSAMNLSFRRKSKVRKKTILEHFFSHLKTANMKGKVRGKIKGGIHSNNSNHHSLTTEAKEGNNFFKGKQT